MLSTFIFNRRMRVRPGETYDINGMGSIVDHACRRDVILDLFDNSLRVRNLESFVFLCENVPVGVAIIGFVL